MKNEIYFTNYLAKPFQFIFLSSIIILILLSPFYAKADQVIKRTSGRNIPYLEHLPSDYHSSNKSYPMLIFLHGTGEQGDGSDAAVWKVTKHGPPQLIKEGHNMTFNVNGHSHSFIVISPQLTYGNGAWPNDYIDEVVKYVLNKYRVDKSAVFLTGLSLGGGGTWRYAGANPTLFAGIAPVAADQSAMYTYAKAFAQNNVAVWAFHGDADNVAPVANTINWVKAINENNADPEARLTVYQGVGHNSWGRAYTTNHTYHNPNLYEWFLSFVTPQDGGEGTVPPANQAPKVDAGQDYATDQTSLTLSGTAADSDGSISKYQWQQVNGPNQASLSGSASTSLKVSNLVKGEYDFKLTATDDDGASASDIVHVTVQTASATPPPPSDCGCDYTVPANQYLTDGKALGIQPGDVICLKAGTSYGSLQFTNIVGTATQPIIIKNCGGKVTINKSAPFIISTHYSKHFRITGTGDPNHQYGIEIAGATSLGITLGMLSTNFEIDHVEIHNIDYAGIMAKTDPSCSVPAARHQFTMYDIKIHDNYIHDTNGEGIYVGHSFYISGVKLNCGTILPHVIKGAQIYNNIVKNTGLDGIQVGAVTEGGDIHDNVVESTGLRKNETHGNGIQLGVGTGGLCYNNVIKNAFEHGIMLLGLGDNVVFNNVIVNSGRSGAFIDSRPPATTGNGFKFFNNTIINTAKDGVTIFAVDDHLKNQVKNNIIINPGTYDEYENAGDWRTGDDAFVRKLAEKFTNTAISNNFKSRNIADAQFVDPAKGNYHLKASSPAVNIGADLTSYGVKFDLEKVARPQNGSFDAGAYEYKGGGTAINQPPVAKAGSDITLQLPINQTTLDGSSSYDPDGSIISFQWNKIEGPSVKMSGANSSKLTLSELVAGSYKFKLIVTDNNGASASDDVNVKVSGSSTPNNEQGLIYKYYEGTWDKLPDFSKLNVVKSGKVSNFNLSPRNKDGRFGFRFDGFIEITKAGDYTFYTSSDDGSKLYINNTQVVNNDGLHASQERSGKITLSEGYHAIGVTFFEKTGKEVLTVKYAGPGISKQIIPDAKLFTQKPSGGTPSSPPPAEDPTVAKFYLINPSNNQRVGELKPGSEVVLGNGINIEAVTNPAKVGSIKFLLNNKAYSVENVVPYALGGDKNGNFTYIKLAPGNYKLKAIPYTNANAKGNTMEALEMTFRVVKGKNVGINSRVANTSTSMANITAQDIKSEVSAFPNPVDNELHVKFTGNFEEGKTSFKLQNYVGVEFPIDASSIQFEGQEAIINLYSLDLNAGMYLLHISNGTYRKTLRLIKK